MQRPVRGDRMPAMCGIAGIVDMAGPIDPQQVAAMRDTLAHRGPDDSGLWSAPDGRCVLGHRRLSILDLSTAGHQPMVAEGGQVAIAYNGEVYNFAELRGELAGLGQRFASDTDTEVVLRAYLQWGIGCLDRLGGMFAMAIYDARSGEAYLVRDRLGIKPLVYAQLGDRLVFGSEIRAVLACGEVPRELSISAAWDYFTYGYVPTPQTIYEAVNKLPPGCYLRRGADGQAELHRWWEAAFGDGAAEPVAAESAGAELARRVDAAVAGQLVADVPTGCYLSGGLDSSIVTGQAARAFNAAGGVRVGGDRLHTFSIGFDVREHSELPYAAAAAEAYGTEHHPQVVSAKMARQWDDTIIGLFDEPFAASSMIPMTFVARLARQHATMALCGEGGDEVFGGYNWYRDWPRFRRQSFWRTPVGRAVERVFARLRGRAKRKWWLAGLEDVELYAQLMGAMTADQKAAVFSPEVAAEMAGRDEAAYFRTHWRADLPPMARLQRVDLLTFLPDLNLTRADRTSMHVSLELRVPLLDHKLVEYVCGLPPEVRNPAGRLKGLFKNALADRLPPEVANRKKKGFSAPVRQWYGPEDLTAAAEALASERPGLARRWLRKDVSGSVRTLQGSRGYKVWVFLQWLRRFAPEP